MMKVAGLLPINFRGVQYNIPVCVWVPQQYPTMPPIPYVQPTPDMDVVRGHGWHVLLPLLQPVDDAR